MGSAQIVFQGVIGQSWRRIVLDPFHAARCEIRRWAQSWLISQNFIGLFGYLEGESWLSVVPATDRKYLAANLPNMRATPLDHIAGCAKDTADCVEFFVGQLYRPCHVKAGDGGAL